MTPHEQRWRALVSIIDDRAGQGCHANLRERHLADPQCCGPCMARWLRDEIERIERDFPSPAGVASAAQSAAGARVVPAPTAGEPRAPAGGGGFPSFEEWHDVAFACRLCYHERWATSHHWGRPGETLPVPAGAIGRTCREVWQAETQPAPAGIAPAQQSNAAGGAIPCQRCGHTERHRPTGPYDKVGLWCWECEGLCRPAAPETAPKDKQDPVLPIAAIKQDQVVPVGLSEQPATREVMQPDRNMREVRQSGDHGARVSDVLPVAPPPSSPSGVGAEPDAARGGGEQVRLTEEEIGRGMAYAADGGGERCQTCAAWKFPCDRCLSRRAFGEQRSVAARGGVCPHTCLHPGCVAWRTNNVQPDESAARRERVREAIKIAESFMTSLDESIARAAKSQTQIALAEVVGVQAVLMRALLDIDKALAEVRA